jgi:chemotaxis protein MotA
MFNITLWLGFAATIVVFGWSLLGPGALRNILDPHGLVIVFGGLSAAMLVNTPGAQLASALKTFFWIIGPDRLPSTEEAATEMIRLSRLARERGGLLALRDESNEFADGFLRRSIDAAVACGETDAARAILETEIRRRRSQRQEDANVFRTLGTLAPMFGLLGTLVGMLQVLGSMSEPTRLGPAMALALSSAFLGIATANFVCVPIAGQIRSRAINETRMLEMIIEGVMEIAVNKPTFQIELLLRSYSSRPHEVAGITPAAPPKEGT